MLAYADATVYTGDLRYDKRRERIPQLEAQRAAAQRLKNKGAEGAALGNLGLAYAALGDARQAITLYDQRLVIARALGDRQGEARGSWNLGLALEKQGDLARAVAAMQVCVDFEQEIGHPDAKQHAARLAQVRQRLMGGDAPIKRRPRWWQWLTGRG